jgi:hypothetical protein
MAMCWDPADARLAVKARTVARPVDSRPSAVTRLVERGELPPPFRLTPTGARLRWPTDVGTAVGRKAARPLAA